MDHLQSLEVDMTAVGLAIDDQNLEQSYELIKENPQITKAEFMQRMGITEY